MTSDSIKITRNKNTPTTEAYALREALQKRGLKVLIELHDGFKTVDLALPKAKLNIEVDGIYHLTSAKQILSDISRGYFSSQKGFHTIHIQNEMIHSHLEEIADALTEACKITEDRLNVHLQSEYAVA